MVFHTLEDSYGDSRLGEMPEWMKEKDPNTIKGRYDRIKKYQIWNLEEKWEVSFSYKPRNQLEELLIEAQGSDRHIILNRPIYVLYYYERME